MVPLAYKVKVEFQPFYIRLLNVFTKLCGSSKSYKGQRWELRSKCEKQGHKVKDKRLEVKDTRLEVKVTNSNNVYLLW